MQHNQDEIVVRGPSTRPKTVVGANYIEVITREALVGAIEQVASGYVKMNVEHIDFLPPIGHWHRAELVDEEDGESHLLMYGHYLPLRGTAGFELAADGTDGSSDDGEQIRDVTIGIEPRNFDPDVWEDIARTSPLPLVEHAARSALPPLVWFIVIPVTWTATTLTGSFLKRLGETAADRLAKWISDHARRARERSRDNMVEVQFEVARNVTVSAFIELTPTASDAIELLHTGLDSLGSVASFAGGLKENADSVDVRLVAFFYRDETWHLGWWATEEAAYLTKWFQHNYPDPKRFLDGPHLVIPDEQSGGNDNAPPSSWIG